MSFLHKDQDLQELLESTRTKPSSPTPGLLQKALSTLKSFIPLTEEYDASFEIAFFREKMQASISRLQGTLHYSTLTKPNEFPTENGNITILVNSRYYHLTYQDKTTDTTLKLVIMDGYKEQDQSMRISFESSGRENKVLYWENMKDQDQKNFYLDYGKKIFKDLDTVRKKSLQKKNTSEQQKQTEYNNR